MPRIQSIFMFDTSMTSSLEDKHVTNLRQHIEFDRFQRESTTYKSAASILLQYLKCSIHLRVNKQNKLHLNGSMLQYTVN